MNRIWFLTASLAVFTLLSCSCSDDNSTDLGRPSTPAVSTAAVGAITDSTAECGGTISADGGADVTSRGVCWSTYAIPTTADDTTADGSGTGSFTSSITGLTADTTYNVRAYAINSAGTAYGDIRSFETESSGSGDSIGTVTDIDGNVYSTIKICGQWWMAEDLRVTHYRNGDSIPNITNNIEWNNIRTGAFCNYNNDENQAVIYGRIYNWFASTDARELAPTGWHMPSAEEWQTLIDCLGGDSVAGGKMKETGTTHWMSPNTGATNESGFTGRPGGGRQSQGQFLGLRYGVSWWSTEEYSPGGAGAYHFYIFYDLENIYNSSTNKEYGFSVRCVMD